MDTELSPGRQPDADSAPVVLTQVTKLFGRFAALRQLSATFQSARLYAIFGPNGAGKSTLLRVIAGLARPTSGTASLFGQRDLRQVTGRIGYMAHASMLYDEMSGLENLRYFAGLYGERDGTLLRQAMITVGLDPVLTRRVSDYSQGMRQRLSLARATLHDPDILLLDEPFSNLDPQSSRAMSHLLGKIRDRGKTVLVVTHQSTHLAGVADESLWISAGAIAAWEKGIAAAGDVACNVATEGLRP